MCKSLGYGMGDHDAAAGKLDLLRVFLNETRSICVEGWEGEVALKVAAVDVLLFCFRCWRTETTSPKPTFSHGN